MTGITETIARAQDGDQDAFREIYHANHAALYRYALSELAGYEAMTEVVGPQLGYPSSLRGCFELLVDTLQPLSR